MEPDTTNVAEQEAVEPAEAAEPEATPAEPSPSPAPSSTFWSVAESALADADLTTLPDYVKELTPDHFNELPTVARQVLKDGFTALKGERDGLTAKLAAKDAEIASARQSLEKDRLALARERAAFAALADDPKIKELLAKPESELPDPLTNEGIAARVDRAVAQKWSEYLAPISKEAANKDLEKRYLEFVDSHPEMKDPGFKKELDAYLTEVNKDGLRIRTPEAFEIVRGRRLEAERTRRATEEARARAESARHVARSTAASSSPPEIPPEIRRNPVRLAAFLEANPSVARAVREGRI